MNTRNKDETKRRLISAVGEILAEKGFSKIGINAIARQAGVDKVLIYRYFGGIDGLYSAYAGSTDFWPSVPEILGEESGYDELKELPFGQLIALVYRRYTQALMTRPLTLEILAWETIERNSLTAELEKVREAFGLELMSHLQKADAPDADWQAITNIFTGAIHYLAVRGRKINSFSGMDLSHKKSWERLLDAIEFLASSTERRA